MKHKAITTIVLTLLLTFGCQFSKQYELETKLLPELYGALKSQEIDISELKSILKKHKVFNDFSGDEFIGIVQQLSSANDTILTNPDLIKEISNFISAPISLTSPLSLDTNLVKGSRLMGMISIFDNISITNDFSIPSISKSILKYYTAKDFNQEFYQVFGLILLTNFINASDIPTGLETTLPPLPTYDDEQMDSEKMLKVSISYNDEVSIDGTLIAISKLKPLVVDFIQVNPKDVLVSLNHQIGTSYSTYVSVYNEITGAYNQVRNSTSKDEFGKKYDDLSKEEKTVIKNLVPKRLSESEPK